MNNLNGYDSNENNAKDIVGMYGDLDSEQTFLDYIDPNNFSDPSAIIEKYMSGFEKDDKY